jgi:hypothetical protein
MVNLCLEASLNKPEDIEWCGVFNIIEGIKDEGLKKTEKLEGLIHDFKKLQQGERGA